ncbi:uncharacterized protein LOC135837985 isoform X2 [Planococcus citri]
MEQPKTKLAYIFHNSYCDSLTKYFRWHLEQELYIDLIFICKCNKKVSAHQVVLGSFSTFLYQLFSDHQQYFKGDIAYVCVPDIRASSMQNILKFIYYGKVALKNKRELSHMYEDLVFLGLPSNAISSESEPFCTYISGMKNSNNVNLPVIKTEYVDDPIPKTSNTSDDCVTNSEPVVNGVINAVGNADGVSSSSSSLPVISSVITLDPTANVNRQKNATKECADVLPGKQDISSEQQITSSEDSSRKNHPSQPSTAPKLPNVNSTGIKSTSFSSTTTSHNEESSTSKKKHLSAVLKKVLVACQDLESVGVSDDENTLNNLQSCIRIVKQCIVDINDLLSPEVTISSQGNYTFIDVEEDWELKIMLDNCLETLPRLEKAIENSNNKAKRRRHRERHNSADRLEFQKSSTTNSNSSNEIIIK